MKNPVGRVASGLVLIVLLAIVIAAYLARDVHFVVETHGHGSSAIWHDDEVFIFVGRKVSGMVLKRYQAIPAMVFGMGPVRPDHLQDDLIVFHLRGERLSRYVVEDFGSGGGAFPYHGRVFFSRGGEPADYPYLWEWLGTNFARVQKPEALAILNAFPPAGGIPHSVSAQIASEGWHEQVSIIFNSALQKRYPISLKSRSLAIITDVVQGHKLRLEGRHGPGSHDILSFIENLDYRQVSAAEYRDFRRRKK